RMIEPDAMSQLMKKDATNIHDRGSGTRELERASIGVEDLGLIKEDIGFAHGRSHVPVIGHCENIGAEGLAENVGREDDRVHAIDRAGGSGGVSGWELHG